MFRIFVLTISILCSCLALAKSSNQVDLIIFAHPKGADRNKELGMETILITPNKNAISLKSGSTGTYTLLGPSKSGLRDEHYLLSRKSTFQVLSHYSWTQPSTNQNYVALPTTNRNGWVVEGSVRVRQGAYYLLDADLQVSPPNNPQSFFRISQQHRLKTDSVYFLDHPRIGMLVKIHKLS